MAATSLLPFLMCISHRYPCVIPMNARSVIQTINRHQITVFCGIFWFSFSLFCNGEEANLTLLGMRVGLTLIKYQVGLFPICHTTLCLRQTVLSTQAQSKYAFGCLTAGLLDYAKWIPANISSLAIDCSLFARLIRFQPQRLGS